MQASENHNYCTIPGFDILIRHNDCLSMVFLNKDKQKSPIEYLTIIQKHQFHSFNKQLLQMNCQTATFEIIAVWIS